MPKEAKNKEKKSKQKSFLKDTKAELKKVIWPSPKQLLSNTMAVLAIVVIIGVIVFVLDVCFDKMNAYGVEKLKEAIRPDSEVTEQIDETDGSSINLDNSLQSMDASDGVTIDSEEVNLTQTEENSDESADTQDEANE